MEAVISPEPSEAEREALLAALTEAEAQPGQSAWRLAALREGTEVDDP